MNFKFFTILSIVIVSLFFAPSSFGQLVSQTEQPTFVKNEIIIKLKNSEETAKRDRQNKRATGISKIDAICSKAGGFTVKNFSTPKSSKSTTRKFRMKTDNILALKYDADVDIQSIIQELENTGDIEYAEPNYIAQVHTVTMGEAPTELVPNDYISRLYWAKNDGTFTGFSNSAPAPVIDADIDATDAWEITTGSPNVTLAVLDSGIDPTNQEFAGRIVQGYDFVNEDNDPTDDHAHGTNVTGIATMTGNNNFGLAGVDWNCKIMPVKVLDENNFFVTALDAAEGINYATNNGADVMNMSFGFSSENPQVLQDAIENAYDNGVVLVCSAGNGDGNNIAWPASYTQTITVGATDLNDYRVRSAYTGVWGSNYGTMVDLVAPGDWMVSARFNDNQAFTWWMGGTSQATPLVAGAATLLLSVDPDLTSEDIRTVLRNTADDQVGDPNEDTPGYDIYHGAGRLNLHQALLAVSESCTIGDPCDDGNICTTNDVLDADCNCVGTFQDLDNDSVCDANDICPGGDDTLDSDGDGTPDACDDEDCSVGSPCNDNNACTIDDVFGADCNCVGTFQDSDSDGVCDASDVCPDGDDTIDLNGDGTPDDCESEDGEEGQCLISTACGDYSFDSCSSLLVETEVQGDTQIINIFIDGQLVILDSCVVDIEEECYGLPCDDGDDCTVYDVLDEDCNCAGYYSDIDNDGVCDAEDVCLYDPTNNCEEQQEDDYCSVEVYHSSDFRYISNVTFGNIDNDSQYDIYGYSDFTNLSTSLSAGSTANISLTTDGDIPPFVMHTWGAWIDYNQDGDFDDADEYVLSTTSTEATIQADVVVPANIVTGATRMRIIVKYGSDLPTPCETILSGEIEDYTVELQSSGICTVGTPCNDGDACTTNDVLDAACNCAGTFTDSDADGICDTDDDCPSDPLNGCGGALDYCDAYGSNTDYEYIDRVVFADIDNTSGDDGGYGDYTDHVATVGLGDAVPLGLAPGFTGHPYNEVWTVWIDFDQDGHYGIHEQVYFGVGAGSLAGHVVIPPNATLGLTGMRVAMQWSRPAHPCEAFVYGEVEDYVVDITDTPQNYPLIDLRNENNLIEDPSVRISPNPTTDFININLQNVRDNGSITIVTLSGKTIMQQAIDADTNDLKLVVNQLPEGMYLIRLDLGDNTYVTERFVKLSK